MRKTLSYAKTTAEISFFYQDLMFLFAKISDKEDYEEY